MALRGYVQGFRHAVEGTLTPCQAGRLLCNIDTQGELSFCIDRPDTTVGNILNEPVGELVRRLRKNQRSNDCRGCWTSCRGSIETLRQGRFAPGNLRDYWEMARPVPLGGRF